MSQPQTAHTPALSPTRHAPGILGCAAVLIAAGAGLGAATTLSAPTPDGRLLDRMTLAHVVAAPARPAPPAVSAPAAAAPPVEVAVAVAPREDAVVAAGVLTGGSFYDSAVAAGATPELAAQAVRLFGAVDFAHDLKPRAPFRLVFARTASADGRSWRAGALLYAALAAGEHAVRVYRFAHDDRVDYLDADGRAPRPLLLRTPVQGAHVTSGFGMRLHPILGFTRMHPGVDFGAPEGSPVMAAGDGVVEEAGWAGGYGRWLKLGHADGYETGYGHLLRYAPGVRAGAKVEQGQVVAFVGSSGLSTGPHLHFEVMRGGEKLDPATVPIPAQGVLGARAARAFAAQKARVDGLLARRPA